MKITVVAEVKSEIVETDNGKTFERHSPDSWLELMGESWETVYRTTELEKAYQEWKADR